MYERCLGSFSSYVLALAKNSYKKTRAKKVGEIDPRCQFHQPFMLEFFVHKCFVQLFSSYISGLLFFWRKNIEEKVTRKMLMKLTQGEEQTITRTFFGKANFSTEKTNCCSSCCKEIPHYSVSITHTALRTEIRVEKRK